MRHPLAALMWGMWEPHRCGLLGLLAAIPACAALYRLPLMQDSELLRRLSFLPMVGSLFFLFAVFKFTETDRANRSSGFPSRLFTLPVGTWMLVTCPMACAVAAVTVVYVCWAKLVFEHVGQPLPIAWPCLYLTASILSFQAIVWTLARFRIARLVALGVCGTAIGIGWLLFRRDLSEAAIALLPGRWAAWPISSILLATLAALSCAAWMGAVVAVSKQRHGGSQPRAGMRRFFEVAREVSPPRSHPFASAARAQCWLEWRRHGVLLPLVVGGILALMILPTLPGEQLNGSATMLALSCMFAAPFAVAAALGKGFGKLDLWSSDLAIPPFLAIRPMRGEDWISAKLKVAALSALATWLLVIAVVPIWVVYRGDVEVLVELWNKVEGLSGPSAVTPLIALLAPVCALITWRMLVAGLCTGVWGKRTFFLGSICLGFALVFFALQLVLWFQSARPPLHRFVAFSLWLPWLLNALFIAKVAIAAWAWRRAIERGVVSAGAMQRYFVCWFAGTGLLLLFVWLLVPDFAWLRRLLIFGALLTIPLARIGLATLALNDNRIR